MDRENEASKMLYLYCETDGVGNYFYSRGTASNSDEPAKPVNFKPLVNDS